MAIRTRYWAEIQEAAAAHQLDPILVEAIVVQESAGNADGFRWEPDFYNRYIKINPDWEWARKKYGNPRRISSSYGLMQPMFPVCIEEGYSKDDPPELLFIPTIGLKWGCKRLRSLLDWADKGWPTHLPEVRREAAIASYNGGRGGNRPTDIPLRNRTYLARVMQHYQTLKKEHQIP